MPNLGHLSAWIQVNGAQLQEYGTDLSADGNTVSCWIPSESGKPFEICYKDSLSKYCTATVVFVDGIRCRGKISRPRNPTIVLQRGVKISDSTYKPFIFSDCKLTDDDDCITLTPGIGEITVQIEEATILGRTNRTRKVPNFPPLNVHEKAKKGVVHGTQLGDAVSCRFKRPARTRKGRTLATFILKYRPLDVLRADGIAPLAQGQHTQAPPKSLGFIDLTLEDGGSNTTQCRPLARAKREVKKERSITLDTDVIDLTV